MATAHVQLPTSGPSPLSPSANIASIPSKECNAHWSTCTVHGENQQNVPSSGPNTTGVLTRKAACMEIKAGSKKWKKRWCWMDAEHISWGKDPNFSLPFGQPLNCSQKPKHKVPLSNLQVEVKDGCVVVTDPACRSVEQLCVSFSEADTASVSYVQEWKKRVDEDNEMLVNALSSSDREKKRPVRTVRVSSHPPFLGDASLRANTSKQSLESSSSNHSDSANNTSITSRPIYKYTYNDNSNSCRHEDNNSSDPNNNSDPDRSCTAIDIPIGSASPSPSRKIPVKRRLPTSASTSPSSSFSPTPYPYASLDPNPHVWPSLASIERMNRTIKSKKEWEGKPSTGYILPSEILLKVFRWIPWPKLLCSVALVSRDWLVLTRSDRLWQRIFYRTYGSYYDQATILQERSLWIEKFFLTKAVESNWLTGKYRKKETIYVSFRTVRELIWSERHLALVYGNTIDFMDESRFRIFFRFSPDVSFIRGVDVSGDIIACASKENWTYISLYKKEGSFPPFPEIKFLPDIASWKADNDIIDVVSFPYANYGKSADRIFTGAKQCTLWDIETQKPMFTIPAQNQGSVNAIQFDENKVICSHKGSKMRIWDLRSGKRTFILKGHQHLVHCFRFNDNTLVSGSKDTTIRIWDPRRNYQCRSLLGGHKTSVRALEISPSRLVSGSKDEVRIWDLNADACTGRLALHDPTFSLTFNESHLFVGSGNLKIFDFSEKQSRSKKNFLRKIF